MADGDAGVSTPRPSELDAVFRLHETHSDGDRVVYYGESLVPERMLVREVWPAFREAGYEIETARTSSTRPDVLVAREVSPGIDGVPWTNLCLFLATVLSTLFVGATGWYYIPPAAIAADPLVLLEALPFTAAVLGVLLCHELGHYVAGRYHGVSVSLPYVIPFVHPFGTLGAVIRMRGQMPDRRVLFDIGAAGPLAGLVATAVVTAVGFLLSPIEAPARVVESAGTVIVFNDPLLMELIATALGEPAGYEAPLQAHPVVIGGWVGMFFTLLNLLPVGQLDGGHILRAMLGERQETVAAMVPPTLFAVAGYLHYVRDMGINESVGLWAFWGAFALLIAYKGPADPIDDRPLDRGRVALGLLTFALGALCFVLVPVEVAAA